MSKDVENKAKDFFDSLKGIKGSGAPEEIIKTLKTGFQGLNKSFDKAADSNTDSKTTKTTEDRERSNTTLKRFTSIDNSLKALIKIESESLKLRKRAIDKNRFSVKKKLKNSDTQVIKSVSGSSKTGIGGLAGALSTGMKMFSETAKTAGKLVSGLIVPAATVAAPLVKTTVKTASSMAMRFLASKAGSSLLSTVGMAAVPLMLAAGLGFTIYKSIQHLDNEKIRRKEQGEVNRAMIEDPHSIQKKGLFGSDRGKTQKTLMQMTYNDMLTAGRNEMQLGTGTEAEKAEGARAIADEMFAKQNELKNKASTTSKNTKLSGISGQSVTSRTDELFKNSNTDFNSGSSNSQKPNMIMAAASNADSPDDTPSNITSSKSIKLGRNVSLQGMNPGTLQKLHELANYYLLQTGKPLQINSGYRTELHQERLYRNYKLGLPGYNAAFQPGKSSHNFGTAFDIQSDAAKYLADASIHGDNMIKEFGFKRPYKDAESKEKWHLHDVDFNVEDQLASGLNTAKTYTRIRNADPNYQDMLSGVKPKVAYADGGFTNVPSIFGEAGPEFAIPFNNRGVRILAEAMNQAMRITTPMNNINDNSSGKMKEYLNNQFIPKLAKAIMQEGKKNSQNSNGNVQAINAFS